MLLKTQRPLIASAKLPAIISNFVGLYGASNAAVTVEWTGRRGVRRTGRIQHPLDGAGDISARPANDELEAIIRDKGYEFGGCRGH